MSRRIIATIAITLGLAAGAAVPVMSAVASSPVAAAPTMYYHGAAAPHMYYHG